jgi:hypothetical protein
MPCKKAQAHLQLSPPPQYAKWCHHASAYNGKGLVPILETSVTIHAARATGLQRVSEEK